jgi:hypothetical protein
MGSKKTRSKKRETKRFIRLLVYSYQFGHNREMKCKIGLAIKLTKKIENEIEDRSNKSRDSGQNLEKSQVIFNIQTEMPGVLKSKYYEIN